MIHVNIYSFLARFDDAERSMSQQATDATRKVVSAQDGERKRFMSEVRRWLGDRVRALQLWQGVAERSTQDRAAWHFPGKAVRSWALSETEGPQRMR